MTESWRDIFIFTILTAAPLAFIRTWWDLRGIGKMGKGGIITAIRQISMVVIVLIVLSLFTLSKALQVKRNYTELHHRFNQVEMEFYKLKNSLTSWEKEYQEVMKHSF